VLDTALRQLRYGWANLTGGRVRVDDVRRLVGDILATRAEFGTGDREQIQEMLGAAVDPDVQRTTDARRWRATVRRAYDETLYYRSALDRLGTAPDDLTLDRSAELPPTPKSALRSLPEAFVSRRASPVFQAWTTGTTATPTPFWFSDYELELAAALSALSYLVNATIGADDVLAVCIGSRAALGIQNTMLSCRLVGAACFLIGMVDPAETLSRLATPVHLPGKKPRVSAITVYPSHLGRLVQEAGRQGYRAADFGLERIFCGGEVLSDALRRRAEEAFGAAVLDGYGMTETFPLGGIVCDEGHLHHATDQGRVEVLELRTLAPAGPGAVGVLVVTPYYPYRETTMVLRLATGDLVRRLGTEPGCGLARLPATSRLLGKAAQCPAGGERPLYQRELLELLEAEPDVPLPCRYGVQPAADGYDLHVLVPRNGPALLARLEGRAADRGLPLRKLELHDDPSTMPPAEFARALLHETTVVREEGTGTWSLR